MQNIEIKSNSIFGYAVCKKWWKVTASLKTKKLISFFKSFNGGFLTRKKCFMLTGKLQQIDVERQQHQQVHPSLMYGQFD